MSWLEYIPTGDLDRFKIYAFFHVYTKYPYFHVVFDEFRRTALRSKIFERFEKITYGFVRYDKWDFEYPKKIDKKKEIYVDVDHFDEAGCPYGEWPTLRLLHDFATEDPSDDKLIWYQHTKGLRRNGHRRWVNDNYFWDFAGDWRRYMTYWGLETWKITLDKFFDPKVRAVGATLRGRSPNRRDLVNRPWLRFEPKMWCFAGNFWWARASAAARLPHPDSQEAKMIVTPKGFKRVGADEHWIERVGVDHMYCIQNSHTDHYHHTMPRGSYDMATTYEFDDARHREAKIRLD